jgi:hypothetical protein
LSPRQKKRGHFFSLGAPTLFAVAENLRGRRGRRLRRDLIGGAPGAVFASIRSDDPQSAEDHLKFVITANAANPADSVEL